MSSIPHDAHDVLYTRFLYSARLLFFSSSLGVYHYSTPLPLVGVDLFLCFLLSFFFFNDTAPTEISPLPLHDALPIWLDRDRVPAGREPPVPGRDPRRRAHPLPTVGGSRRGPRRPAPRPATPPPRRGARDCAGVGRRTHGAPGADLAQRPHSGPQHAAGRPVVVPLPRLHGVAALLGPRYRARARVLAARGADFRPRPGRLSRGRDRRVLARTTPPRRLAARAREQGLRELPHDVSQHGPRRPAPGGLPRRRLAVRPRRAPAATVTGARWELALAGWRLYAAVAACAFVIYLGAFWNGFALDDRAIILRNPQVASPSGLWRAFLEPYWRPEAGGHLYRPLAVVTYALDALVDGAPWFHFVNLLWHAAGSVAVAALARRLIGATAGRSWGGGG